MINLVNQSCVDYEEMFQRLRDFLCKRNGTYDYSGSGIGWTLYDAVYAVDENTLSDGDYFVAYSAGESASDDMYVKFMYEITTYWFMTMGYLSWDAVAHTGGPAVGSYDFGSQQRGSSPRLWIYGDLDAIIVLSHDGTSYYGSYFGKYENLPYPDTKATSSSSVSSGTDVVITVDAVPSWWWVGQNIFIRDDDGGELITIKAISGLDITADVTTARAAGCKLQASWSFFVQQSNNLTELAVGYASHIGDMGSGGARSETSAINTAVSSVTLEELNQASVTAPLMRYDSNPDEYYGTMKHLLGVNGSIGVAEDVLLDRVSGNQYRYFGNLGLDVIVREV